MQRKLQGLYGDINLSVAREARNNGDYIAARKATQDAVVNYERAGDCEKKAMAEEYAKKDNENIESNTTTVVVRNRCCCC